MSLSKEQLKHDRINLGRLVKTLKTLISDEGWGEEDQEAWVKAQRMSKSIQYARQLLLNVDYYDELHSQTSSPAPTQKHLHYIRETLDKLDSIVDEVTQRLAPKIVTQPSYLSLIPISINDENSSTSKSNALQLSPEAGLIPSDTAMLELRRPSVGPTPDPTQDLLLSSSHTRTSDLPRASSSQPPVASSLVSASLQAHEELSNELSRMATQLKRNAEHFSESLEKDKTFVQSAAKALENNYDTMTKERVRLRDYRGKSFGTTWMIFGALVAVSIAWVFMFIIIRVT